MRLVLYGRVARSNKDRRQPPHYMGVGHATRTREEGALGSIGIWDKGATAAAPAAAPAGEAARANKYSGFKG